MNKFLKWFLIVLGGLLALVAVTLRRSETRITIASFTADSVDISTKAAKQM